jgi:hypothetical protein
MMMSNKSSLLWMKKLSNSHMQWPLSSRNSIRLRNYHSLKSQHCSNEGEEAAGSEPYGLSVLKKYFFYLVISGTAADAACISAVVLACWATTSSSVVVRASIVTASLQNNMLLPTDLKPMEACTQLLAEYEYDVDEQVESPVEEEVEQGSQ